MIGRGKHFRFLNQSQRYFDTSKLTNYLNISGPIMAGIESFLDMKDDTASQLRHYRDQDYILYQVSRLDKRNDYSTFDFHRQWLDVQNDICIYRRYFIRATGGITRAKKK